MRIQEFRQKGGEQTFKATEMKVGLHLEMQAGKSGIQQRTTECHQKDSRSLMDQNFENDFDEKGHDFWCL